MYVAFPRYPCSLGGDPLGRNTGTRKLEMLLDASQVPPRKCAGGGGEGGIPAHSRDYSRSPPPSCLSVCLPAVTSQLLHLSSSRGHTSW